MYARQITLRRPGEEDTLVVTGLLDAGLYPAEELLEMYRRRWGIEQLFGLARFIDTGPEATVSQASYCLALYNLIGVVRGSVAQAGHRATEEGRCRARSCSSRSGRNW